MKKGTLYGIGLGPGDPELITVKGKRILESCIELFYPKRSTGDKGVALSILSDIIDTGKKNMNPLTFPMVSDKDELSRAWLQAAEKINAVLETGMDAVFITEGDPLFFSTFSYLLETLDSKFPGNNVEVVPGITAYSASSARGKVAVGQGMGPVVVIPASSNIELITDMVDGKKDVSTLVLMKIKSVFDKIVNLIEEKNLNFIFVEKCSMSDEVIIADIKTLKEHKPDYFSLIIISDL